MFLSFIGAAQNNAWRIITHTIMSCIVALASNGINAAIVAPSGCIEGSDSVTCTLADLFPRFPVPGAPGTAQVSVDEILFRNWTFLGSDDALNISPEDVSITFSEDGRRINLDFISESLHSGSGGLEGNFSFAYEVFVRFPDIETERIDKMDVVLANFGINGEPAEVGVDTCLFTLDCGTGGAPSGIEVFARTFGDPLDQTFQTVSFSPSLISFDVSTHIFVSGSPPNGLPGGSAELNEFRQSFYRVPEPDTLALILLPGLMLVGRSVISNYKER